MNFRLGKNNLKNLVNRIVNKILQKNISDGSIISKMIDDEIQNIEGEVIHKKDSSKNYGNASEYGTTHGLNFGKRTLLMENS